MRQCFLPWQARAHAHPWWRFLGMAALFTCLGPLAAALAVNGLHTVFEVAAGLARGEFGDIARLFWGGLVVGNIVTLIVAYSFGIVSAVGVGLAVAIADRVQGGASWGVAVVAALAFWALVSVTTAPLIAPGALAQWIGALLVAHVLATTVCTWLARRIFG